MSVIRIASRYAKSLLDLSIEGNKLDTILGDVKSLQNAVANKDLANVLKSPIIKGDKKKQILNAIFNGKVDELTMKFMDLVVLKGRESYLKDILDEFMNQYRQFKSISIVKVTSAEPLTDENITRIKEKLLASKVTADNIEIETVVDPSILGGIIIQVGDKLYDASVAHKLQSLRKEFI